MKQGRWPKASYEKTAGPLRGFKLYSMSNEEPLESSKQEKVMTDV